MAIDPFGNSPLAQDPSLLSSIGSRTLSGLEYLGGLIDKLTGARAVRGGLSGNPQELLSIIPGSDVMGLTNAEESVGGRDLLEQYGVLGANTPGLDWGDVGGFAAEVALDPTAWASFGTTAMAKRALPEAATAGLQGLGRLATSPTRIAATGLDSVGLSPAFLDEIPGIGGLAKGGVYGGVVKPLLEDTQVGRSVQAIFDPSVRGTITPTGQKYARGLTSALEENTAGTRGKITDYIRELEQNGYLSSDHAPNLRRALEGVTDGLEPELVQVANSMKSELAPMLDELIGMGVSRRALDDIVDFFPRKVDPAGNVGPGSGGGKAFNTKDPFNQKRKSFLKNIRGGTEQLKEIIKDPEILKFEKSKDAGLYVLEKYGDKLPPVQMSDSLKTAFAEREAKGALGAKAIDQIIAKEQKLFNRAKKADSNAMPSELLTEAKAVRKGQRRRATALTDWVKNSLTEEQRAVGYFDRHPLVDLQDYLGRMGSVKEGARSVIDATTDLLKSGGPMPAGDVGMSVNDLLSAARMNRSQGAKAKIGEALGLDITNDKVLAEVGRMRIPSKEGQDLVRVIDSFTRPKAVGEITKLWDSYTSMFKAGVLTWPARYVRDATTGAYLNAIQGVKPGDYADTLALVGKDSWASKLMNVGDTSGVIKNASEKYPAIKEVLARRGLPDTPENATNALRDLIYQYEVVSPRQADMAAPVQNAASTLDDLMGEIVGTKQTGPGQAAKQMLPRNLEQAKFWNIRGVRKAGGEVRDKSEFAPVKAGEELAYAVEATNRIPYFLDQLKKGVDPAEAAKNVREMHVDYRPEALTSAEQQIRRIVPFYAWQKGMLPYVLKQLTQKPGGAIAQSIRGQRNLTQESGGFVPEDLRRQSAFQAPGFLQPTNPVPGTERFITGFGLPQESVLENLVVKGSPGSSLAATLQKTGSMLHPGIKGIIETMTGVNLYTGRQLQDLDSPSERLLRRAMGDETLELPQLLDTVLSNSPITRAMNTARTITDPRDEGGKKAFTNLLTGFRLQDVDMAKAAEIELREQAVEGLGDHARTFRSTYIPKATLQELEMQDPETWGPGGSKRKLLDLYQSMNKR